MDFIRKEKGKKSPSSKVSKTSQPKLSTLSSGRKLREEPMEVDQFASTSKCQNIEEVQDQRCDDFAFVSYKLILKNYLMHGKIYCLLKL